MPSPHTIATSLFGAIDWQTEVHGFCRCPGESLHTSRTGPKDCQVHIDGAPTLHCFHASCTSAVAAANKQLRRELGQHAWAIRLPSGKVLNSGDVLQPGGQVLPREVIEAKALRDGKDKKEALVKGEFDVVYTSRGVLGWLPDIQGWARVAAQVVAGEVKHLVVCETAVHHCLPFL